MKKGEKKLLWVGILGTVIILAMAFADRWLYPGNLPPGVPTATLAVVDSEDNGAQPMSEDETQPAFIIDPAQSEARFTLGELLGGEPTTVIGVTNTVSGTIYLSADSPQDAQVGEIVVDARGLATDNDFRNRAVHSAILSTNTYPKVTFMPTSISGLPDTIALGESVPLEITGNLTIKDVTREVTFTVQVTQVSETQLDGYAETMIAHADYGISIPSVPRVADVDEEVLLEIDFVALLDK